MEWINFAYLFSAILFILGLKKLSSPKTAAHGNTIGASGMLIAIVATLLDRQVVSFGWIFSGMLIGSVIGMAAARKVKMTAMPEMVALLNGFGGGASLLVALSQFILAPEADRGRVWLSTLALSTLIGAVTLTGSLVAWGKLQGFMGKMMKTSCQRLMRLMFGIVSIGLVAAFIWRGEGMILSFLAAAALLLGILLVAAVGGADMPVVIALLNSCSGLAAAATGFVLMNNGLIISGSLVGASGIILCRIMCKAMNRSLGSVLFGGPMVSDEQMESIQGKEFYEGRIKRCAVEEVVMLLEAARRVVIAPGYGLAVAQAQYVAYELAKVLEEQGIDVKYAIHPVAGRMPGHMNVLLADAEVPYDKLVEMENINPEFPQVDVTLVLGANDVTNPVARENSGSPLSGMPILEVDRSKTVVVVKRSLSPGFSGVPNRLFINDNSLMLFGDVKTVLRNLLRALSER